MRDFLNVEFSATFMEFYGVIKSVMDTCKKECILRTTEDEVQICEKYMESNNEKIIVYIGMDKLPFEERMYLYPQRKLVSPLEAISSTLSSIYENNTDVFDKMVPKLSDIYVDIWKKIQISMPLIDTLNSFIGVEAKMYGDCGKIFVMFENQSAIEYTLPAEKNKSMNILVIEYSHKNKVNNNLFYEAVMEALAIPSNIIDLPET